MLPSRYGRLMAFSDPDVRERLRGGVNKAAVVIFYVPSYEDAEILFVVRSIREDDRWSGQVAFPGGMWKPIDRDLYDTAVRELMEEVSIELEKYANKISVLRIFNPSNMPELKVTPILVQASSKPAIRLSEELSAYFWASLKNLEKTEVEIELQDKIKKKVLAFRSDKWVIWGMTARILEEAIPIISRNL
ncbi:MAG: CoA pyrophosphatase [Nitrososphaerota archaeon]